MLTRRRFLTTSSAAVAAVPFVRSVAPGESRDKVRLAVIGCGNRGAKNLDGVRGEEIVALCDVDPAMAAAARTQHPSATFVTDYRKLFDAANRFDAVVVSTPDHSHALPAVTALGLGKPVYCEKPLARTVEEVRRMRAAAAKANVPTQMGTQIHAEDNYRRVVEIVRAGLIGPVNRVHVWFAGKPDLGKRVTPTAPVAFDTDLWLGPTTGPYFTAKHTEAKGQWPHYNWRYWWQFAGGKLGDFGCHFMDLPFWALNLGAPTAVAATGTPLPGADNTVPGTMRVDYKFPAANGRPAVHLTWSHGVPGPDLGNGPAAIDKFPNGVLFEGAAGKKLFADYTKYRVTPDEFARDFKPPALSIPKSVGHHREWLDAIRGTGKPLCEFGYAGNLAEAVLLGNVAYRAGTEIAWDATAGKVTNAPAANEFVEYRPRKGWELPS